MVKGNPNIKEININKFFLSNLIKLKIITEDKKQIE